jgi:hypothetical protein
MGMAAMAGATITTTGKVGRNMTGFVIIGLLLAGGAAWLFTHATALAAVKADIAAAQTRITALEKKL